MSLDPVSPNPAVSMPASEISKVERQWAMYAHVAAPVVCVLGQHAMAGLLCFAAPLAIYLIKKKESAFVAAHAKEAANFTVTVLLAAAAIYFGSMQLAVMLLDTSGASTIIMMITTSIIALGALSLYAIAAFKALDGQSFRYPLTLRFIR